MANFMTSNFLPFLLLEKSKKSLLKVIKTWKDPSKKREQNGGIILTNLTNAFDTISHSSLLGKLEA